MNKSIIKILTLAGIISLATGCGGGGNNTEAPKSEAESTPEQSVAPSSQEGGEASSQQGGTGTKVEIAFWHTFGQTIVDNLKPQIKKFEELVKANDGVDVTVSLVPCSNYQTINEDINKGLTTGNIPTIAVAYPDHVADYLEAEGNQPGKFIVNLNDYINDSKVGLGKEKY